MDESSKSNTVKEEIAAKESSSLLVGDVVDDLVSSTTPPPPPSTQTATATDEEEQRPAQPTEQAPPPTTTTPASNLQAPEAPLPTKMTNNTNSNNKIKLNPSNVSLEAPTPKRQMNEKHGKTTTTTNNANTKNENTPKPPTAKLKQQQGRLSMRDMNWNIPTNTGTQDHIEEMHGTKSWQYSTLKLLHSTKVQMLLMVLLLSDIIILFMELFLLSQYPSCHIIERDAISCCAVDDDHKDNNEHRWLASSDNNHHYHCTNPNTQPNKDYDATCDTHKWSTIHTIEKVLFGLTITILSIFFVELNIEMIALQPQIFFKQFFFVMDYVIVTTSLVLELTFYILDEATIQSFIGLLVLARIWRFIRIGHGIIELTHEWVHHEYSHLLGYTEELEEIMMMNGMELPEHRPTAAHSDSSSIRDGDGTSSSRRKMDGRQILEEIERKHRLKYRKASSSVSH